MNRFENFLDVLLHVQKCFKNTTRLSKDETGNCFYSHKLNNVGCSIGCCFVSEEAEILDENGTYIQYMGMDDLAMHLINTRFNTKTITLEQLVSLQRLHDTSENVQQFRERLHNLITEQK